MNLSLSVKVVRIKDARFPNEVLSHTVGIINSSLRKTYNLEMANEAGITTAEAERGTLQFKGDPFAPTANLYDKVIQKVEGYTLTENDLEVDVMAVADWRDHVPVEHKNAVILELIPRATVIKN